MKTIYNLLNKETKLLKKAGLNPYISSITNNTKKLKKASLFIAIKGTRLDGHRFCFDAVKKGAKAILIQDKSYLEKLKKLNVFILHSPNTRKAQAIIASKFFNEPSKNLKVFGITGTNGKTTTSNLILQYLSMLGEPTGLIGTIWYKFKDTIFDAGRTTPDAIEWQKLLYLMKQKGAKYVVSEVSSHAIEQYRVYNTKFDGCIFTNLTQDHLDYHLNMENYFQAKRKLFIYTYQINKNAVFSFNTDDFYGLRLYKEFKDKIKTISYGKFSDEFKIKNFKTSMEGSFFEFEIYGKSVSLHSKLRGDFNIYNIAAAFSFLVAYGIDLEFLIWATPKLKPIRGRYEIVPAKDFLVINDYAHTPDALENILKSLKKIKRNKIIVVFGAGGDRDKTKRPKMGKIAEEYADIIILTSDNPRSEDPKAIIEDIKSGMDMKKETLEIIDREEAIKEAIKMAKPEDIVLIAGKGHETYQIIGDKIYHFDDSDVAKKYLLEFGKN
jgi:UDP-N-acetylmuramoyl-L-alanyl-D-glutamate--2,6-diaminopimelate ligase